MQASWYCGYYFVTGLASGQQTILKPGGCPQSLDQKQTPDEKQQNDHQANQTSGLPLSCFVLRVFIRPMVMSVHRSLHSGLLGYGAFAWEVEAKQGMVAHGMFR
jgi:hypothetical protein